MNSVRFKVMHIQISLFQASNFQECKGEKTHRMLVIRIREIKIFFFMWVFWVFAVVIVFGVFVFCLFCLVLFFLFVCFLPRHPLRKLPYLNC